MLSAFFDEVIEPGRGFLSPHRISRALRMPLSELSRVTQLHRNTLARKPAVGPGSSAARRDRSDHRPGLGPHRELRPGDHLVSSPAARGLRSENRRGAGHRGSRSSRSQAPRGVGGGRLRLVAGVPTIRIRRRCWRVLAPRWAHAPLERRRAPPATAVATTRPEGRPSIFPRISSPPSRSTSGRSSASARHLLRLRPRCRGHRRPHGGSQSGSGSGSRSTIFWRHGRRSRSCRASSLDLGPGAASR